MTHDRPGTPLTVLSVDADALRAQRRALWSLRWERTQRVAARVLARPDVSIFGCYDAGNVGDLALGVATAGIAGRLARTAFDSPRSSQRLTPPRAAILAGGGVVTARPGSPLAAFSSYVGKRPCAVAVIGVSSTVEPGELSPASLATLREAAWLSTRSQASADSLAAILGRDDIVVQPDIAFALKLSGQGFQPPPRRARCLALNVSPFLHSRVGTRFVAHRSPSAWFAKHLPDQAAWYEQIGPRYVELVRALLGRFLQAGWRVRSIPLAPEDDLFARSVLSGLAVEHQPYESDPLKVMAHFAAAERALVTRFHAHVFALLTGTPLGSFAYSPKCNHLMSELGLPRRAQAEPRDWVHELEDTCERLAGDTSVASLEPAAMSALEAKAYDLTRRGVLAVLDRA